MAKRRNIQYSARPPKKQVDLDFQETSDTGTERASASKRDEYDDFVKVPPPFKGDDQNGAITWSDLSYTWRVITVVAGIFLTVGVPSIWFASKMDSKVGNIENEVSEIKQTTKNLTETSIKNSSKIEVIEKSLDRITNNQGMPNQALHMDPQNAGGFGASLPTLSSKEVPVTSTAGQ